MLATGFFFVVDLVFFSINLLKIVQSGGFPLLVGLLIFTVMATWGRGRQMMLDEGQGHACRRGLI